MPASIITWRGDTSQGYCATDHSKNAPFLLCSHDNVEYFGLQEEVARRSGWICQRKGAMLVEDFDIAAIIKVLS